MQETFQPLDVEKVAELIVDLWKIMNRAQEESCERVITACERAVERTRRLGFELESPVGKRYDTNMQLRVVDHEPGDGELRIALCLSPAVYYGRTLVREAEVVTTGSDV